MSDTFSNYLKKYKHGDALVVIFFASVVGLLCVLPSLLAVSAIGDAYQGIPFMYINDEDHYLARIQEMHDGHYLASSMFFYEYKDSYSLVPPVGEAIYYSLGKFFGVTPPEFLILAKFLLPAILFVVVYSVFVLVVKELGTSRERMWGGIGAGMLLTLGVEFINYNAVLQLLSGASDGFILSQWTRPVNPISGAIFLFSILYFIKKIETSHSTLLSISTGILLGFSSGYIFSYQVAFVIICIMAVSALLLKDRELLKIYSLTLGVGLLFPVLYWSGIFLQIGDTVGERNGIIFSHIPIINKVLVACSVLFAGFLFYIHSQLRLKIAEYYTFHKDIWLACVILLSCFVVYNYQIITGFSVWPYHLSVYTNLLCLFALCVISYRAIPMGVRWIWRIGVVFSICIPIAYFVYTLSGYQAVLPDFRLLQNFAPVFSYLRTHAEKDCVVLMAEDIREQKTKLIPGLTQCNVYMTTNLFGVIPLDRVYHNFYTRLRIHGVTPETVDSYLQQNRHEIRTFFYTDWVDLGVASKVIKPELIETLTQGYTEFYAKDFVSELRRYRIDYFVTTEGLESHIFEALPSLKEVLFIDENVSVYTLE